MMEQSKTEADLLVRSFLDEPDEIRRDQLLEKLVCQYAQPVIKRVVTSKLNVKRGRWSSAEGRDQEDIGEEAVVQLIRRLSRMKSGGADLIDNFDSYVATVAYNACSSYLRAKYPARSRLRNKLRYILSHHEQFAIWQAEQRMWLCGFASWRNQVWSCRSAGRLQQLRADPFSINYLSGSTQQERNVLRLMKAVFDFIGAPVELDDLVEVASEALGENDQMESAEQNDQLTEAADKNWSDTEVLFTEKIDKQAYVKQVWKEICDLPAEQRAAILLNLKDGKDSDVTTIFVSSGVATITEMAAALGLSIEVFLDLWKKLPLSDEDIAIRMSIRIQQVGSLRQSARRRLSRRIAMYELRKNSQAKQT